VIGFVNSIIPTICEGLADTKPGEKMPPNFSITSCLMVITFNSIVANSCGLRLIEVTLINMLTSGAWIGLSYTPVNPSVDMRMFMMFVIISIVLNFPPSYKKEMMQRKIFLIGKVTPAVS
jgi:phospholipid N-methyltransferase